MKMPVCLPKEIETEVVGHGDGTISITQYRDDDEVIIWLTVHQFSTIFNHEKTIVKEALEGHD